MIPPWLWAILTYAGMLLVGLVLLHMISRKRPPAATTAWLLLTVFVPWVGVPAYLIIGGRKVRRAAARKGTLSLTTPTDGPDEPVNALDHLIRSNGLGRATEGNRLDLHQDAHEAYRNLLRLLESAEESISVAMYIFAADTVGRTVRNLLAEKARQGLRVRLLVDDIGSLGVTRRFFAPLTEAGGELAYFMPIFRLPFRWRTDLRNHRKIVVVDSREVLAGGRNLGEHYFAPSVEEADWIDLSFTIRGPAVRQYVEIFEADWASTVEQPIGDLPLGDCRRQPDGSLLQVVPSGPDVTDDPLFDAMLKAIYGARRRLWITTPYFVPEVSLDRALICAARSGVDVRVVTPVHTDNRLPDLARWRHLRALEAAGGTVWFYTPSMLHAKAVVCDDDVAIIGSANMDVRSLFLNFEAVVFCYDRREVTEVANWIERLFDRCREGVGPASRPRRFSEQLVGLVEPLL